jgi:class 3 adenylate cyclase
MFTYAHAQEVTPGYPPAFTLRAGRPIRRLAAILVADVAGYSRLMDRDEAGTHQRLRRLRALIIEPLIALHGGWIVRVAGDGLLVVFASAIEAVCCAVALQRSIAETERPMLEEKRVRLRVGINVADILLDGAEIAGGGVNVAARLEAIAAPGGICVSQAVKEQINEQLGVAYVDGGQRRVKNISRPIHVFHVVCEPASRSARTCAALARFFRAPRRMPAAGLAVAALIAVATTQWLHAGPLPAETYITRLGVPAQLPSAVPRASGAPTIRVEIWIAGPGQGGAPFGDVFNAGERSRITAMRGASLGDRLQLTRAERDDSRSNE